jgi:hypothetical protein
MMKSDAKALAFFTIAGRKSSPYEGDRSVPIRRAAKEKDMIDQMAADNNEARANRLSARDAKKEDLEAKEDK